MDATLCQFSAEYMSSLIVYNKILTQRNALLKSFYENRSFDKNLLEVYNEKLISAGKLIFEYRKTFLAKFIPIFKSIYKQIFDGTEEISIIYDSDLLTKDFEQLIASRRRTKCSTHDQGNASGWPDFWAE